MTRVSNWVSTNWHLIMWAHYIDWDSAGNLKYLKNGGKWDKTSHKIEELLKSQSFICLHFQSISFIYSWIFNSVNNRGSIIVHGVLCSFIFRIYEQDRWWITPSNKSISRPKISTKVSWTFELMNIFFPPGKTGQTTFLSAKKGFFWLLRQRWNLHFILSFPHSFLKSVTQERKKSQVPTYIYLAQQALQSLKIVLFRLTYLAQIALTFDRIFYLQKS